MATLTLTLNGAQRTYNSNTRPDLEHRLRQLAGRPVDRQKLQALVKDLAADGTIAQDEELLATALTGAALGATQISYQADGFEARLELPPESASAFREQLKQQ